MPLKLVIHGAAGRMGRQTIAVAAGLPDFQVVAAIVRPGSAAVGQDAGAAAETKTLEVSYTDDIEAALQLGDVALDFSVPAASVAFVQKAAAAGKPVVVGTTGFSPDQVATIREAGTRIPVLIAPSLSLGVNLLIQILPAVARALGAEYDVEIVEAHHRYKQDAPSGTALRLAEEITAALDRPLEEVGRYGRRGIAPRQKGDIGVHAVRAGGIVGEHRVIFASDGEQVEILHRAFSRETFARGGLRAAQFLVEQKPGFYTMQDVLAGG